MEEAQISAVVAAAAALSGVLLSGVIQWNLQRRIERHDREQRSIERLMGTKREVFLRVAEAMGTRLRAISEYMRLDGNQSRALDLLSANYLADSQLQLAAEPSTLAALFQAHRVTNRPILELVQARIASDQLAAHLSEKPSAQILEEKKRVDQLLHMRGVAAIQAQLKALARVSLAMRKELGFETNEQRFLDVIDGFVALGDQIKSQVEDDEITGLDPGSD